ncbi:hypothetical protein LTQ02_04820 [Vibrio splendidus]|uniref:hypothetical protein n=1 Tax=Vibrio splendidus TaxID=29497 RepID=UPI001FB54C0E|nr:hypothetical protein [Vibrio splendidus]UOE89836.1 hypothetical protein LTQ02_04820 [Vibrio splendidus]
MSDFLLDLDKPEYDDLFITSTGERELWQRDAMHSLVEKLTINLEAAKQYCKQRQRDRKKTNLSHNSIFLTGERGSGKTVFLRNVEQIWQHKTEMSIENDIGFLDVIDPTMLMNNDSFANVVVAEIYRKVEEHNSVNNVNSADRSTFYNALKSLSESLGKQDEFNGHSGIDKILRYNSGIQVEKNFHRYVEEAIKILSCSALVLPIDDVDMSLQKAHEVIDDVRRLLGCPYIIPIVSGDVALYQQMINVDFDHRAYKEHSNEDLQQSGVELSKGLSDEYLKKVFPAQMRLPLNSIARIISGLNIKESGEEKSFYVYMNKFYHEFYFLLHRQQYSNELSIPDTARELTQLVRSFSLSNLNEKDGFMLWSTFRSYSEAKKDAEGYVNSMSYLIADSRRNSGGFSLRELPMFNPLLQLNRIYSWAERDIYATQIEAANRISEAENGKFIERKILESDKTLTSMPPYDYHSNRFHIPKSSIVNEHNQNERLLAVYTSNNYYSALANTTPIIFVGRAFELIILSFISNGPNLPFQVARALYDTPLHSVFSLNITKHISALDLDDDDNIVDSDDVDLGNSDEVLKWLVESIDKWKSENKVLFNHIDGLSLLPIFAKMFNQVFTQISFLKTKLTSGKYKEEHLSDFACRFEYIVNNAALIQMNDVKAVLANTAQTNNYNTLRNNKEFFSSDKTITRNISAVKNSEHENSEVANLFYNALSTHPIFQMNLSISNDNQAIRKPSYRLPWKEKKLTLKQVSDEFNMLMNKAVNSSKSFSRNRGFDENDFAHWFNQDFTTNLRMAERVIYLVDHTPEIEPKPRTVNGRALGVMRYYVTNS